MGDVADDLHAEAGFVDGEERKDITFSPLLADIFTASAKSSQWASDRVEENLRQKIEEMSRAFVDLIDDLHGLNKKIDSLSLANRLGQTWVAYESAQRNLNPPQY